MKSKIVLIAVTSIALLGCENAMRKVDPNNKVGEQNGQPVYSVSMTTNQYKPKYTESIERNAVMETYCENGGTILGTTGMRPSGGTTTVTMGNRYVQAPRLTYDLKFVCNA